MQAIVVRNVAARAAGTTMSAMVVGANCQAQIVEKAGHVLVTPTMLAQSVHNNNAAARRYVRLRAPICDKYSRAISGLEFAFLALHI